MIKEGDTESGGLLAVLQFDSIWFSTSEKACRIFCLRNLT